MSSLAIVNTTDNNHVQTNAAPIVSAYSDQIRPLLNTIDKLRSLNVMSEGIHLPTIVVVGDQSSGKSSVLESLAGISLPRGQNICTRVPLVMRLENSTSHVPEILLKFNNETITITDEDHISEAISKATDAIAGTGKGVSDTPLTLHVKKAGVPDITMIDLPGITRVPVNGQPENIYDQIAAMVMKQIEPLETIILNVLPATSDFTNCESICMSRKVDKNGELTLAVVTKVDKAPEGDALITFTNIIMTTKESLVKILVDGDFLEFPDDSNMHATAHLADMLSQFSNDLQSQPKPATDEFLMDEIKVVKKCKSITLPNFIRRSAFLAILSQRIYAIHTKPVEFIKEVWDYVQGVLSSVLTKYSEHHPEIKSTIKRVGHNLISKIKEQSVNRVIEIVEMEKQTDYTCNPEYMKLYTQKIAAQGSFIDAVKNSNQLLFAFTGLGNVHITHLRKYHEELLQQAFDIKAFDMRGEVEKMLEESPLVASKRETLRNSIKLLKEAKEAVAAIVDQNRF
ncbi:hypothetical protein CARUB_v10022311mg [Capsella rubella]|uniref:Dynamin-type G domain-containing protein n=1 Tax=Capsella rubella TaxID=81985 RepID=R0I9E5_9BRAS|nr:hypothetical protein CARUB_v10022311mg [Capsella rubella]